MLSMSDQPSERAMKAAVEMEVHAVLSTTTAAKARELDDAFPAYDSALAALRGIAAIAPATLSEAEASPAVFAKLNAAMKVARAVVEKVGAP
jgi:hypothetical protein